MYSNKQRDHDDGIDQSYNDLDDAKDQTDQAHDAAALGLGAFIAHGHDGSFGVAQRQSAEHDGKDLAKQQSDQGDDAKGLGRFAAGIGLLRGIEEGIGMELPTVAVGVAMGIALSVVILSVGVVVLSVVTLIIILSVGVIVLSVGCSFIFLPIIILSAS